MDKKDKQLWQQITQNITPLDKKADITHAGKPKPPKHTNPTAPIKKQQDSAPQSNEIDHQTARRLKRGQIPIEARLDLHGLTQNQAYDALQRLIPGAYNQGKRCVLVITGKGTPRSQTAEHKPGILKQKVPQWLDEPHLAHIILKIQTAHIKDGGEGALYVYLRRQRPT